MKRLIGVPLSQSRFFRYFYSTKVPANAFEGEKDWLSQLHTPEKEAENLLQFGASQHFNNDPKVFTARYKEHWSHFTVAEVDADGREVRMGPDPSLHSIPLQIADPMCDESPQEQSSFCFYRESVANEAQIQKELQLCRGSTYYLECTLRKRNIAHAQAIRVLGRSLGLTSRDISFKGVKDRCGDTYQRIRLRAASPHRLLWSIHQLPSLGIELYDFQPASAPFKTGEGFAGNRFQVILTNVKPVHSASVAQGSSADFPQRLSRAIASWERRGFPNYYGPQRFSWFGGARDPSYYLLHGDTITAAYQLLCYTNLRRPWTQLLERAALYPLSVQEHVRRVLLRELTKAEIKPSDMEHHAKERFFAPNPDRDREDHSQENNFTRSDYFYRMPWRRATQRAFESLPPRELQLLCQKFPSYLWNTLLSYLLQVHGNDPAVLSPSLTLPSLPVLRKKRLGGTSPSESPSAHLSPGFRSLLQSCSEALCSRYGLCFPHTPVLPKELFSCASRPARVFPQNVSHEYDSQRGILRISFFLPKGCYASVGMWELLKSTKVSDADSTLTVPTPDAAWEWGAPDPCYLPTLRDLYPAWDSTANERRENELLDENGNPGKPQPTSDEIAEWSRTHMVRNGARHLRDTEQRARELWGPVGTLPTILPSDRTNLSMERYVLRHPIPLRAAHNRRMISGAIRRQERQQAAFQRRNRKFVASRPSTEQPLPHRSYPGLEEGGYLEMEGKTPPALVSVPAETSSLFVDVAELDEQAQLDPNLKQGIAPAEKEVLPAPHLSSLEGIEAEMARTAYEGVRIRPRPRGQPTQPKFMDVNGSSWNRTYCYKERAARNRTR